MVICDTICFDMALFIFHNVSEYWPFSGECLGVERRMDTKKDMLLFCRDLTTCSRLVNNYSMFNSQHSVGEVGCDYFRNQNNSPL